MTAESSMARNPKVSIIIAAYNSAGYIGDTIRSVFAQTFTDYELIIVNDGSTDDTEQALKPFQDRIIYICQNNRGPAGARNTGLRQARGDYAALLDNDDLWEATYLEKMIAQLEREPGIGLIYPNAVLFDSPRWEGKLFQDIYPSSQPVTFEKLLARECNVFASSLFRREVIEQFGMFDESLPKGVDDFDLWLRLAQRGVRFTFTTEPLVHYRKRRNALSMDTLTMLRGSLAIYEKVLTVPETTPGQRALVDSLIARQQAEINWLLMRQMIAEQDFAGASQHLTQANDYYRSPKLKLLSVLLNLAPHTVARLLTRRQTRSLSER
jgi:glycosyltransferase involved in cell wall biosynthesis